MAHPVRLRCASPWSSLPPHLAPLHTIGNKRLDNLPRIRLTPSGCALDDALTA